MLLRLFCAFEEFPPTLKMPLLFRSAWMLTGPFGLLLSKDTARATWAPRLLTMICC